MDDVVDGVGHAKLLELFLVCVIFNAVNYLYIWKKHNEKYRN